MGDLKTQLEKIKPRVDVDRSLQLKELIKENAHLHLKIKKLTLQLSQSRTPKLSEKQIKKFADQELRKSFNTKYKKLQYMHQQVLDSKKRKAEKLTKECLEHNFLKKRIKQVLGPKVFMDLINHVDNPRSDNRIITEERIKGLFESNAN